MKDYQIKEFENGATIVLKKVKNLKFTSIDMGFKVGAIVEDVKGTAHFLEHCLFLGTQNRTRDQIDSDNSKICWINAMTSLYYTMIKFKRANFELDNAFSFASDILLNTKFNSSEIKKEKAVVANEILMVKERDKRNVYAYHNALWSPYINDTSCVIVGKDIDKITKKDLENYRNKYYTANNFAMYVISSLPMSKIVKYYKKYILPQLKISDENNSIHYDLSSNKPSKMQIINLDQDKIDVVLTINIPFGIKNLKNRFARLLVRLYFALEEPYNTLRKKGLIYSSDIFIDEKEFSSSMIIRFTASKDNVNKIIDEYAKELKNLFNNGMDKDIYENLCKQLMIAEDENEQEDSLTVLNDIVYEHITNKLVDKFNVKKELKSLKIQDVNDYIKLYNNPENKMWITILGNIKNEDVYTFDKIRQKFFGKRK